jgi:hypothetical protein
MLRLTLRGAIGVLSAALATACLGGQTGQPGSLHCNNSQLSPSAAWGDTTVRAGAEALAGTYEVPLIWQPAALDLEDNLQLTIVYDGGSALRDCNDRLRVPVTVTLTTSESGIAESGDATLELPGPSSALAGSLSYEGERVALDATLAEVAGGVALAGSFESLDEDLPGASASFHLEP